MKELSSINLERVYCESPQLEIPPACYDQITSQYDIIPYTRYLKTLKEFGIFLITLDYQDNSNTFKESTLFKNLHQFLHDGRVESFAIET